MIIVVQLIRFLARVAVSVAVAALIAAILAPIREGASYADRFVLSCYVVGCVVLLLAVGGNSPGRRMGTIDPWFASFAPRLVPTMSREYSGTTFTTSALLGLTAIAMLVLGAALDSR